MPSADELFAAGNDALSAGRAEEAFALYQQAVAAQPDFAEAVGNAAVALAALGRHDEALTFYDRALTFRPGFADFFFNRGNSLVALERNREALASFESALRSNPQFAQAWTNRGVLLRRLGYVVEALECHRNSLQLQPQSADAHSNYGLCLAALGRVEDAIDHYDAALQVQPDNVGARCNRAQLLLLKANFHRGWKEYESRWQLERARIPDRGLPRWNGEDLNGRTILLRHEQGLGDTIMFCRYAKLVQQRGGKVVFECPNRLQRLLSTCRGIDTFVDRSTAVVADCEAPLIDLPGIFGTDLRSIPSGVPYLQAESERIEQWRTRLPASGLRIGICWQGNPEYPEDAMRSIPLRHFAPLAAIPDARLISLQMGGGKEQAEALAGQIPTTRFGADLDADGAFVDTAAIMMHLDLVVTSDTSIVHLAGAIGRPVWLALSTGPEWRWMRDRDDSPWYPTARLFRQDRYGDWAGVFSRIQEELIALKAQRLGPVR
jgi:Tfp pilus assembly protein PilF